MNTLDILLAIVLLLFAIGGFRQGFIIGMATLVGLFLGIWAAVHFSGYTMHIFRDVVHLHTTHLAMVSFVSTFLAVLILVFLLGKLLNSVVKVIALGFLNRMAGAIFGIAKGCLILSAFLYMIVSLDPDGHLLSMRQRGESKLYKPIAYIFPAILPLVKEKIIDFKEIKSDSFNGKNAYVKMEQYSSMADLQSLPYFSSFVTTYLAEKNALTI
jgi:membrane protein required for colicin V production